MHNPIDSAPKNWKIIQNIISEYLVELFDRAALTKIKKFRAKIYLPFLFIDINQILPIYSKQYKYKMRATPATIKPLCRRIGLKNIEYIIFNWDEKETNISGTPTFP